MKNPTINLNNGYYEVNQIRDRYQDSWAYVIMSYNGGYKSAELTDCGIWSIDCQAGRYLQKFYKTLELVTEAYLEEIKK